MRKVIMLVTLSGERHHFIPGEEVEFEAEEAQRLVDGHFAKYVEEQEESVEPDESVEETEQEEVVADKEESVEPDQKPAKTSKSKKKETEQE